MQNNEAPVDQASQADQEQQPNEFETVKARLEEIARAVDDENLSLDDALDLYEEAVKLGLQASNLLEVGIVVEEEPVAEEATGESVGAQTSAPGSPQANDDNAPNDDDVPTQA
ncbi:MAG: exodeoxyribonuclease VII small subunit [Eggerthellaceae bacterium]|nr:exodeoxyribonuclease VII small subunit [Eggerthellaceae bacterium]